MMTDTVERFSNRVANYVAYRPDYPHEVIEFMSVNLGLIPAAIVADIGSGTGISAKLFLENGNVVYGVEPNEAMRKAAEDLLKNYPNFKSIDGTAESTNLNDDSVDFVIAAQAFHWFDRIKTPVEFRRILRKNGWLCLIWNERQLDSTEFLREYECFLSHYGTDYEKVRHDQIVESDLNDTFQVKFEKATFKNSQVLDFTGLKGRVLSASYMPSENHSNYPRMITELERLFEHYQHQGKIEILYDTNLFYCRY